MRHLTVALLVGVTTLLCCAGSVQAAAMSLDKPCYGGAGVASLRSSGFEPYQELVLRQGSEVVADAGDGFSSDDAGNVPTWRLELNNLRKTQLFPFTVTRNNETVPLATVTLKLVPLTIKAKLSSSRTRPSRIRASGWTDGKVLYAHMQGPKGTSQATRTVRIGRLQGACSQLDVKRKLFSRGDARGRWKVRFDTQRAVKLTKGSSRQYLTRTVRLK